MNYLKDNVVTNEENEENEEIEEAEETKKAMMINYLIYCIEYHNFIAFSELTKNIFEETNINKDEFVIKIFSSFCGNDYFSLVNDIIKNATFDIWNKEISKTKIFF